MLTIRKDQIGAFNLKAEHEFHLSIKDYLHAEMPVVIEGQTDDQVLARIAQAERNAAAHGIEDLVPLVQYICLALALGPEFELDTDVRAYLSRSDIDQETKMESLIDELEEP